MSSYTLARDLQYGAVVRLSDGRRGWLWRGKGRNPYRVVTEDRQVFIKSTDSLLVICTPAQTAAEWLAANRDEVA